MEKSKSKSSYLLQAHQALGTTFWVECFDYDAQEDEEKIVEIEKELKELLADFENRFSRFTESSLVRRLGRGETVPFDDDLYAMLSFGESLSHASHGSFSLYLADDLIRKGYGNEEDVVSYQNNEDKRAIFVEVVDDEGVRLSEPTGVDFGGIGKGYVIDMLAALLQKHGCAYFLINGGGDMYATSNHGSPITIFLEHPTDVDSYIAEIELLHAGFAASSSFKRMWKKEGKEQNHFVTKGEEVWGGVFVVAPNALIADTLATTILINHRDVSLIEALSREYEAAYMLTTEDGVFIAPDFPKLLSAD